MNDPSFTIRPEWYSSQERAEQEWDHVWSATWHMGPRVEELADAGDTFLHTFGRESLIFVRDNDNDVRGYFNVCRHRGNRLLLSEDGPGFVRELRCAFHGWCFGLDGGLQRVPYAERFDAEALADRSRSGLRAFRTETWAGWVWFTLSDAAPDLTTYLGPLKDRLERYRMDRARIVDYKTFEFGCNWKTCFDSFHESYHFQSLHREVLSWGNEDAPITLLNIHSKMINEYGRPSRLYEDQVSINPMLAAVLTGAGIDPAGFAGTAADVRDAVRNAKRAMTGTVFPYDTLNDSQLTDAHHYTLFPALHFNLFPEFYVAMRYRPHPSGDPERMYFDFILCVPLADDVALPGYKHRVVRGGDEPVGEILTWGDWKHPVVEQVLAQDVGLVEFVQKGMKSRSFEGPILSTDERRISHHHRMIDDLITGRASVADLIATMPTEQTDDQG